jgi:virginiamycin B lyase
VTPSASARSRTSTGRGHGEGTRCLRARGGPYTITINGNGRIFANKIETDTVVMLDPKTEQFQVFKLPSRNVGIRKAIVDAQGRYWYMGSHNGRLGVIE